MPRTPVTHHAIERWQLRVDRRASGTEARLAIGQVLALGRWRPRPRHWMVDNVAAPGTAFVYWCGRPGVCVIVADGVAVTIVTRAVARDARRARGRAFVSPCAPHRLTLVEPWRWDGYLDSEEAA